MAKHDERIDAHIANAADFAKPILIHLRELIHEACPDVEETWKWSFPMFTYNGKILCHMAAFKNHCTFRFWKQDLLKDNDDILNGQYKTEGGLGQIKSIADLPKDAILKKYIKQAMKLHDEGFMAGSPRHKPTEKEKEELQAPAYFAQALKKNKVAEKIFKDFSYSHRKEYIEWLEEAKTEATREKRMAQAIEWIAEGKKRNWKYMKS